MVATTKDLVSLLSAITTVADAVAKNATTLSMTMVQSVGFVTATKADASCGFSPFSIAMVEWVAERSEYFVAAR